jgi:hypothetical protein
MIYSIQNTPASSDDSYTDISSILPQKSLVSTMQVPEQSLTAIFAPHRSCFKGFGASIAMERSSKRRSISFPLSLREQDAFQESQPPVKRRRFERRNSKTAAMLSNALTWITPAELEEPETKSAREDKDLDVDSVDPWDGGLEIAGELVRQLTLRHHNKAFHST